MTDKAKTILKKMKHWKRLNNPERRERILDEFNRAQMDDVGPVGGDQRMAL